MTKLRILVVLPLFLVVAWAGQSLMAGPIIVPTASVPRAVKRVSAATVEQYALVKFSTTSNHVTPLLSTDSPSLMTGIAQDAAGGSGTTIRVQEVQGLESSVVSDGTTSIAIGDLVQPSSTTAGRVAKGTANPICTATSAASAVAGTVFTCL